MRPVNIYALTRIEDSSKLERLERQMSGRSRYLKIKKWEIEGLKCFSAHLNEHMKDAAGLSFYYSFTMPKLGKEFDLLRVGDDFVVNVELKSGNVTDDAVRKQLLQNRYYLSTLGKNMYFYTFINRQDRLVRLSNSGRIVDTEWEELARVLERQDNCFTEHIEELFKEDRYLISPLTDPGRFLRQEFFLTLQQKDIRKAILKNIRHKDGHIKQIFSVQGFTGLPGTGKTILLYDIAMQLSKGHRVCVLHFGSHEKELEQLDERLKRVDFYYCDDIHEVIIDSDHNLTNEEHIEKRLSDNVSEIYGSVRVTSGKCNKILNLKNMYSAILVDEGHRVNERSLSAILDLAKQWMVPVIFSYDREDAIAPEERALSGAVLIENIDGYTRYKLTNRIRMNSELSSFIACVMCVHGRNYRHDYPSVSLVYANDDKEAEILIKSFERDGYIYIWDESLEGNVYCDYGNKLCMNDLRNSISTGNVASDNDNTEFASKEEQISFNKDIVNTMNQKVDVKNAITSIEASAATCKEFDKVVMMIDDTFYYDENGFLRQVDHNSSVRNLYHGLSRAKKNIAIVVKGNTEVFEALLYVLQR